MTDLKSYEEFVLGAFDALLKDCASLYPALAKEFKRDLSRLSSAIDCHGVRFALDTLPAWRKHFDTCLSHGRLTPSRLFHFGPVRRGGSIPRLFRGLVLRVFDDQGLLRPNPDVQAISLLRQLLGVVRRMRLACSVKDSAKAVQDFIRIDQEIRPSTFRWNEVDPFEGCDPLSVSFTDIVEGTPQPELPFEPLGATLPYGLAQSIQRVADYFCSKLGPFDPAEWRFKHGPGAVSDHPFGAYKYDFDNWPDRLEKVFPIADFAYANYANLPPSLYREPRDRVFLRENPAVLHAVPKTISTPRLIASEPTSLQWCQQAVRDFLYTRVSETVISGFIDFRRQGLNGHLALEASRNQTHATIDLSSASDRISCWAVERLFRRSPTLLSALAATRSVWLRQTICSKSPQQIMLQKYSTMGNATTFPVQSLFFLTVCIGVLSWKRGILPSDRMMVRLGKSTVRVFGDDLIVPLDCAADTVATLHALGLRVNTTKTFLNGKFRESCGVDAYDGHDVTSASIMDVPKRTGPGSIVSSVDVHNNLCSKGYVHLARFIRETVTRRIGSKIRFVAHDSGLFGWSSLFGAVSTGLKTRYNRHLHRLEVKCFNLRVKTHDHPSEEEPALQQFFTERPEVVTSGVSSLCYQTRRPKAGLAFGWAATTSGT